MTFSSKESSSSVGALWLLIGLHFRGVIRRMARSARTLRGCVFFVLGTLVFCAWLGPAFYQTAQMPRADPQIVRTVGPFLLLAFCLANLIFSAGEAAIAFTLPEVDFLFPGPFSRHWLLGYKILKSALGTIFTAMFFTVMMLRYGGTFLACVVGAWLTIQFMQLFAMALVMFAQSLGQRAYSVGRKAALLGVLAVVAIVAAPKLTAAFRGGLDSQNGPVELIRQIHANLAIRLLLAPFDVFIRALTARSLWPGLAAWGTLALLINLAMLALVIALDADYLETAATASQRRYDLRQRMRRGGIVGRGSAKWRVLPLPWLAGAGPIAWRQLTGALRSTRRLLILLVIIAVVAGPGLSVLHPNHASPARGEFEYQAIAGTISFMVVWFSLFLVASLKFDFRDDLDRIDLLRSLPLRPAAVAAGQLIAPVLVLALIQGLVLAVLAVVSIHGAAKFLWAGAAFAIPLDVLLVGIENLLFMMFPIRVTGMVAGDMQLFGRQMVVFFCKFLLMLLVLALCAALGALAYFLCGRSWLAGGLVAWLILSSAAIATVPLLAGVYSRFDPSVDTPA